MAVLKRLTCKDCGKVQEVDKQDRTPPPCPKCGSKNREYGKKWIVYLMLKDEHGRPYRYYRAHSTLKAEATAHEAEKILERDRGHTHKRDVAVTFEVAVATFKTWADVKVEEKALAAGSHKSYMSRLNVHLAPYFKGWDVRKIDEMAVEKYRKERFSSTPKPTPATVNREVATLKRILSIAKKRKLIAANPLEGLELLDEDNKQERFLSPAEVQALLAECSRVAYSPRLKKDFAVHPAHLRIIVVIALNTGLRIDGVLTLRWDEVDAERQEIRKIVKGGKEVRIPMTPTLMEELKAWRKSQAVISPWVIPSPKKVSRPMLVTSNFGLARATEACGWDDVTMHTLRHTFATNFIMATKDIHTLAQILGHSSVYVTERYSHLLDDHKRDAMAQFANWTDGAMRTTK